MARSDSGKRIGLLGGSFNPAHQGHLHISLSALRRLNLDEIWWMVTPQNPLKIKGPATYDERIKNCGLITRNYPILIKQYEHKINATYSYETIKYLRNKYNFIKFFWLMGADNLINFDKWQYWKKIFQEVSIVVFKRHSYNSKALNSLARKKFINYEIKSDNLNSEIFKHLPSWSYFNNKEIKISSTEIRQKREILRGQN